MDDANYEEGIGDNFALNPRSLMIRYLLQVVTRIGVLPATLPLMACSRRAAGLAIDCEVSPFDGVRHVRQQARDESCYSLHSMAAYTKSCDSITFKFGSPWALFCTKNIYLHIFT